MVRKRITGPREKFDRKNVQERAGDPYKTASPTGCSLPRVPLTARKENPMRSQQVLLARCAVVELIVTLSILSACSDSVTSPPPVVDRGDPPLAVSVAFCAGLEPTWIAFQDGDGSWTQSLPATTAGKVHFRHTFMANRGAVAQARDFGTGLTTLSVQYGAPAELATVSDTNPVHCGPPISKTLLGTVAGVDTTEVALVSAGFSSSQFVFPDEGNTFSLRGLIEGPQDILATRTARVNGVPTLTKVILRHNPELPDSATLPILDFSSAEAFAPAAARLNLTGLGPEGAISLTKLRTAISDHVLAFSTTTAAAVRSYNAIPEAKLQAGDLQLLIATAAPTTGSSIRSSLVYFRSPLDQTLAIGPESLAPALSTIATAPALRLRAQLAPQPDYDRITSINYQQGQTIVSLGMTAAYVALNGGGYDLLIPDFTGVSGFESRWALHGSGSVFWTVTRMGGTLGLGPNAIPVNGSTVRYASTFDTLIP
jgi:hypothetical protein